MMKAIREELGVTQDIRMCAPHLERKGLSVPAVKIIAGTPMCLECWRGVPLGDRKQRENNGSL